MLAYPDCALSPAATLSPLSPASPVASSGPAPAPASTVACPAGEDSPCAESALEPTAMAQAAPLMDMGSAISAACGGQPEEVLQLECHVDHLTGEEIGAAIEALSTMHEVLDVLWLGGIGKKNRPCGLLRVMCLPAHGPQVGAAVVRHSHSLGLRWQLVGRTVLPRKAVTQDGMPAKSYVVDGQDYVRVECDALKVAAQEAGVGLPAMRITSNRP